MQPSRSEGKCVGGGREEDISLTSSQGFLSHILLHASAAKKVMHVASSEVAFKRFSRNLFLGGRAGWVIRAGRHAGGQLANGIPERDSVKTKK